MSTVIFLPAEMQKTKPTAIKLTATTLHDRDIVGQHSGPKEQYHQIERRNTQEKQQQEDE